MENKYPAPPLVTIIIPSYNRANLIHYTLDSVQAQKYKNWECLVIDDGSTDKTIDIIKKYQQKDPRFISYYRKKLPKGAPTCRNIGLEKSRGKYIIFLDSDDILFPHALENRIRFLEHNQNLDFCVSDGLRGEYPIKSTHKYLYISTYKSKEVLKEFFNFSIPWNTLNPTYKTNSLKLKNIFWDPNIKGFQDIDFHIQIILHQLKFDYVNNEPDCLWTSHNKGNIGLDLYKNNTHYEQKLYILNKYKNLNKHKKSVELLALNVLHLYFTSTFTKKVAAPTPEILKNSCFKINNFELILLKIYLLSLKNKISIIPRVLKAIFFLTGNKKLIKPRINSHFLKEFYTGRIPIDNIF